MNVFLDNPAPHYPQKLSHLGNSLVLYKDLYPVSSGNTGISKAQTYAGNCPSAVLPAVDDHGYPFTRIHPILRTA